MKGVGFLNALAFLQVQQLVEPVFAVGSPGHATLAGDSAPEYDANGISGSRFRYSISGERLSVPF